MQILAQNPIGDSLSKLLLSDKEDTNKAIHLNALAWEYKSIGSYDTALRFNNEALLLSQKINFQKGIAGAYGGMGNVSDLQGDYSKALEFYNKALNIDEEINNRAGIAKRLGNIGIVYDDLSDYPKALDYYLRALKINEELNDKGQIAKTLGNIGIVYYSQGDYVKTLEYYERALKMNEELGKKMGIAVVLGNMGSLYDDKQDFPKALEYYLRALKIEEELGLKQLEANNLGNIGLVYYRMKQYDKALENFKNALKLTEELGYKDGASVILCNMGVLYLELAKKGSAADASKNFKEAYDYLYRSLALTYSIGGMNQVEYDFVHLSELYEASNIPLFDTIGGKLLNKEEMRLRALHYYRSYVSLRDTLFNEENKRQLVSKELNFEFSKKEAATMAEQEKKDAVTKIVIYSVSGGFLIVLVLAVFIFRGYKQKQKANHIITEQKYMVEEKQKEIIDSINYARRIQQSLLPTEKYIAKNLERLRKK